MIVAGLGCRKGVTFAEVEEALAAALYDAGLRGWHVDLMATAEARASEPALAEAARHAGVTLHVCSLASMKAVAGKAVTRSARVEELVGVPSVAETAALAAAGRGAKLLGPRIAVGGATCAIAVGDGS